jgi:hypothetical protein
LACGFACEYIGRDRILHTDEVGGSSPLPPAQRVDCACQNGEFVRVSEDALRVVQLNVDSLVRSAWSKRRHEIVTWLDELNADIVCLKEVWQDGRHPNTAGWIAEHAAGNWHWEFGGFPLPEPGAVGADPSLRFGSANVRRQLLAFAGRKV